MRLFSYPINVSSQTETYPIESFQASDWYESEEWGKGRVGIVDTFNQVYTNNIVYSDTILESTKINGLSNFGLSSFVDVTMLYGDVQSARAVGSVLKMITDSAVISAGMGVQEYADATGDYTVATSDKVVGYQRVSQERYGTVHPESVIVIDGALYFWDYKNASVIRDSGNGLFPISGSYPTATGGTDHKMRTFFRQVRDTMLANTYTDWVVWFAYERNYDLLYAYFKDTTDADNNVLISYHVSSGRWYSQYEWSDASDNWPQFIGGGGRFFTSTIGEDMYKHFSATANRCTFYGSAKQFELRVYTAQANNEVKVYDRFAIQANSKPVVNDVRVSTIEDADGLMVSEIPANYIERIENGYYAPFLRNAATYVSYSSIDTSTEMVTGWTNVSFDTLTSSGGNITRGLEDDDGEAYGTSNTLTLKAGMVYSISYNLTLTSGYPPVLRIGATFATSTAIATLSEGSNTVSYTA
jgi:hypothetical protein